MNNFNYNEWKDNKRLELNREIKALLAKETPENTDDICNAIEDIVKLILILKR